MLDRRFASEDEVKGGSACCHVDEAVSLLVGRGGYKGMIKSGDRDGLRELARLCPAGGLVVGSFKGGTVQVATGDSHSMIVGCSGRGKTRRCIIPMVETMVLASHNIVVNDMKAEVLGATGGLLSLMGYAVYVVDLRHPARTPHTYNPLSAAWDSWAGGDKDGASRLLRNFACTVFSNSAGAQGVDPFWENSSIDYFTGLSLGMLEAGCTKGEFTLESVSAMDRASMGGRHSSTGLDKFFSHLKGTVAASSAAGTLGAPSDTKASILSVFRQALSIYCSQDGLMSALSKSSFDASVLAKEGTAIFLISPDENSELAPIATAILGQLMTQAIALAEESDEARERPVDFVIDEFGNLAKRIPSFQEVVSACRSRGIKLHICVQSDAQLDSVYGKDLKNVIVGNIYNQLFLGSRDPNYLKQLSDQLGEYMTPGGKTAPRMSHGQLQRLEKRADETEAVVLMEDLPPFVGVLPDYETLSPSLPMTGLPKAAKRASADRRGKRPIFDVEAHVRKWEQEKVSGFASEAFARNDAFPSTRETSRSIEEIIARFSSESSGGAE